jgi:hypothetical protein
MVTDAGVPDMSPPSYHLRVDPLQPNKVWFTTRWVGDSNSVGLLTMLS